MQYSRKARHAIKSLSPRAHARLEIVEAVEQGEIENVSGLCSALEAGPVFFAYACLAGDGRTEKLQESLGFLSSERKTKKVRDLIIEMRKTGCHSPLIVVIDDFEPCRAWQWEKPQNEVTEWCRLLTATLPGAAFAGCDVQFFLCSDLESGFVPRYEDVYPEVAGSQYEVLVHQNLRHIRRYPNKKRIGNERESTVRKVAQYAVQGLVLERIFPNGVLIQTETPWSVKDPLYDSLRQNPLPIVHLFPDERR